jgi:Flp pilus assembly protein TadB
VGAGAAVTESVAGAVTAGAVSKERARRRAARLAEAQERQRVMDRRAARAARWRALRRRLPRRARVGRITTRRSRGQRAGIAAVVIVAIGAVWYLVDSLYIRIGVLILSLVAVPALVTLTLDRSHR